MIVRFLWPHMTPRLRSWLLRRALRRLAAEIWNNGDATDKNTEAIADLMRRYPR